MKADHSGANDLNTHLHTNTHSHAHDIAYGMRTAALGGGFVEKGRDEREKVKNSETEIEGDME